MRLFTEVVILRSSLHDDSLAFRLSDHVRLGHQMHLLDIRCAHVCASVCVCV